MTLHELVEIYEEYASARDAALIASEHWERTQFEAAEKLQNSGRVYLGTCGGYAIIFRGHGHTGRGPLFELIPAIGD